MVANDPSIRKRSWTLLIRRYYDTLLVRIFKNSWFSRFARKEGISDGET
jgi:hypothetical protein